MEPFGSTPGETWETGELEGALTPSIIQQKSQIKEGIDYKNWMYICKFFDFAINTEIGISFSFHFIGKMQCDKMYLNMKKCQIGGYKEVGAREQVWS